MSLVHSSPADFVCVGIQSWDLPLLYSPLSTTAGIAFVQAHTWAHSVAALLDALSDLSVNTYQPATV